VDGVGTTGGTFSLTGVAVGAATITVSDIDTAGAVIGTPVVTPITIAAATFPATVSVTVTVS
jgi:hypothetical protein